MPVKVITLRATDDLQWGFQEAQPGFQVPSGSYTRRVNVDPFPCYSHDREIVEVEAARVAKAFPLPSDVTICILDREPLERTNAWCDCSNIWSGKEETPPRWTATIVMAGKRIPPHPAMTRYLVAHEYGHAVARHLKGSEDDKRTLYDEYQRVRGFTTARSYGGGTWHASVEELFANDFRILVVGAEVEFWPHPGFARPEGVPAIVEYWKKATETRLAAATAN